MLDRIGKNSNGYARAHKAEKRGSYWKNTDRNDLVVWIAIVIYQSNHKKSVVAQQYLSEDLTAPLHSISQQMGLSWVEQIKRYLHV